MNDNSSIWSIISVFIGLFVAIRPYILPAYQRVQRWHIKKTLNVICGSALIGTGLTMFILSGKADADLYSVIGFAMPFTTPSIKGLTVSQESLFGSFISFFFSTMMIGGFGTTLGIDRIRKSRKFRDPPIY